ncbi:MAG TPA: hypothetical protein VF282_10215 [Bacillota bacterium]
MRKRRLFWVGFPPSVPVYLLCGGANDISTCAMAQVEAWLR